MCLVDAQGLHRRRLRLEPAEVHVRRPRRVRRRARLRVGRVRLRGGVPVDAVVGGAEFASRVGAKQTPVTWVVFLLRKEPSLAQSYIYGEQKRQWTTKDTKLLDLI